MREERRKGFIEELQALEEGPKRRVLLIASVVSLFVVTYLWLGYFNNIVGGVAQTNLSPTSTVADQGTAQSIAIVPSPTSQTAQVSQAESQNFFVRIGSGMAAMYHSFIGLFEEPRQYIIQPK